MTIYLKHCELSAPATVLDEKETTYVKTLAELGLLLVDYAEAEINLVRFFEIRLNLHDLRKGFLGVVVTTVPIVEYTDPIPQHGVLRTVNFLYLKTRFGLQTLGSRKLTRAC